MRPFLQAYARAHGLDEHMARVDEFFAKLQQETGQHEGVNVLGEIGPTATLLWTSAKKLEGVPAAHKKELCSIFNVVLRDDIEACMSDLAKIVHGVNLGAEIRGGTWVFKLRNSPRMSGVFVRV